MIPDDPQQLTVEARQKESRGDVILQVTETAWKGYFQHQGFMDVLASTGTLYPSIVVVPDDWVFDAGMMQVVLRRDPKYQREGMLIAFIERIGESNVCRVRHAVLLPGASGPMDRPEPIVFDDQEDERHD